MPELTFLGTANAIPDEEHENTYLAVSHLAGFVLIDCPNNPIIRLGQAGLEIEHLTDLIVTHFHPDHVAGVPSLLMSCWLLGRQAPLNIYGLAYTLDRLEGLMESYQWRSWPGFYPVTFQRLPEVEMAPALEKPDLRIYASPVNHMIPNAGLRFEALASGQAIAYSSDTEPCPQVARLAQGVQFLVHEATGAYPGHSSAAQAGQVAAQAGAMELYLIHYHDQGEGLVEQASATFTGPVRLAEDLLKLEF